MKRASITGVVLVAVFVLGAVGASSASAWVGPLCVKVDPNEQGFWDSGACNKAAEPRKFINAIPLFAINRGLWCARIDALSEKIVGGSWFPEPNCTGAKVEAGEHIKVEVNEGPWYRVNGKDLGAGETRLLLATAKEEFTLEAVALGQKITCNALTLPEASQMQITGSAAGAGGKSKEVIDFTGCTQTGNGAPCEVTNGLVVTGPVLNLLGYSTATRGGPVLVLFEPETGKVFTTVKYTGAGCKVLSQAVSGTVIALAQVGGAQVAVGSRTETLHGEVKFHKLEPKAIFIESGGVVGSEIKAKLELAGIAATLNGAALLLVDEGGAPVNWGVFS